jgi:hypothetical protein
MACRRTTELNQWSSAWKRWSGLRGAVAQPPSQLTTGPQGGGNAQDTQGRWHIGRGWDPPFFKFGGAYGTAAFTTAATATATATATAAVAQQLAAP